MKKNNIAIKELLLEMVDPIKLFYKMQYKNTIRIISWVPIIVGLICLAIGFVFGGSSKISMVEFMRDILGDFITLLALFVSFTMGYLSIILSSSSENITDLKNSFSKSFKDNEGNYYSLYQILITDITYTVIIEIIFLILCMCEKFVMVYCNNIIIKVFCAINVGLFLHVVMLILIIVKNIYYSFWKSE